MSSTCSRGHVHDGEACPICSLEAGTKAGLCPSCLFRSGVPDSRYGAYWCAKLAKNIHQPVDDCAGYKHRKAEAPNPTAKRPREAGSN